LKISTRISEFGVVLQQLVNRIRQIVFLKNAYRHVHNGSFRSAQNSVIPEECLSWVSPGKYKAGPPCSTDLRHSGDSRLLDFFPDPCHVLLVGKFSVFFSHLIRRGTTFSCMQASHWKMSPSEWLNYQMALVFISVKYDY